MTAVTGCCQRCGKRVPLDAAGKVTAHKAPRARKFCVGGGSIPRREES
jgi:hypothetical protein